MTDPTENFPPLTPEDFKGWANHDGIDLIEDEDATWVVAYGHVDLDAFAAAVNTYDDAVAGPIDPDDLTMAADVLHGYAVTTAPGPEWGVRFLDVTAETPSAFPITWVSR